MAEIGDKTQLLAILLAARFRRPLPIIAGIFVATLVNHAGAALVGKLAASVLDGPILTLALGLGFLAMAAWALIPDKDEGVPEGPAGAGAPQAPWRTCATRGALYPARARAHRAVSADLHRSDLSETSIARLF